VTTLRLAFEYDDEQSLGEDLLIEAQAGRFASITEIQSRYLRGNPDLKCSASSQHTLVSYDELLSSINSQEAQI